MQPHISQLKSIFEHKLAVFNKLKKYIKPLKEFAKDEGLAYDKQQSEGLLLEEHFFGKDKGLLPLINELIELNDLLLSYEKPSYIGLVIQHYDKMMEQVEKEQKFLKDFFRKTLIDVIECKAYKEYWTQNFASYKGLLNIIRLDLTYFYLVLKTEAKNSVIWLINLINRGSIDEALDFLEKEDTKILSEKKIDFFKGLLTILKNKEFKKIDSSLKEGKDVLKKDEYGLLAMVIRKLKATEKETYLKNLLEALRNERF